MGRPRRTAPMQTKSSGPRRQRERGRAVAGRWARRLRAAAALRHEGTGQWSSKRPLRCRCFCSCLAPLANVCTAPSYIAATRRRAQALIAQTHLVSSMWHTRNDSRHAACAPCCGRRRSGMDGDRCLPAGWALHSLNKVTSYQPPDLHTALSHPPRASVAAWTWATWCTRVNMCCAGLGHGRHR